MPDLRLTSCKSCALISCKYDQDHSMISILHLVRFIESPTKLITITTVLYFGIEPIQVPFRTCIFKSLKAYQHLCYK